MKKGKCEVINSAQKKKEKKKKKKSFGLKGIL